MNSEQEIVMSIWIDEISFQLKSYDIVSLVRNVDDLHVQANKMNNEVFQLDPGVQALRAVVNPKLRYKAVACITPHTDESNKVRARCHTSDHRDNPVEKKIPPGYKIIGVKGFKNTNDGTLLHIADFIIWKPKPGWLDITPKRRASRMHTHLTLKPNEQN